MVLDLFLDTLLSWIVLLMVIPIAGRIAAFSFPGWGEALWKLAVVAAVTSAITVFLTPVIGILASLISIIAFWVLMVKWFDVDLFGAVIIVVVSFFVQLLLAAGINAIIALLG